MDSVHVNLHCAQEPSLDKPDLEDARSNDEETDQDDAESLRVSDKPADDDSLGLGDGEPPTTDPSSFEIHRENMPLENGSFPETHDQPNEKATDNNAERTHRIHETMIMLIVVFI